MGNKKRKSFLKSDQTSYQLSVLMMEYNNFHDKVKWVIQSCSTKTIQALVSLGVLFGFCINGYYHNSIYFFVDVSMCVIIPILALGIICISLSTNIQVLSFGEYLITVEKKINRLCCEKNHENFEKIMNWEQWRVEYGIARDRAVYYDSAFLYVTSLVVGVLSPVIRISYMYTRVNLYRTMEIDCWIYMSSLCLALMTLMILILLHKTTYGKQRINDLLSTPDIVLGTKRNEQKAGIVKIFFVGLVIYFFIVFVLRGIVRFF